MSTIHDKSTASVVVGEHHRTFHYRDPQHTPYNKRSWEETSMATLRVNAHIRTQDWLEILTEEHRTNKNNDVRTISHHITLNGDQARQLRDMLNEQFPE